MTGARSRRADVRVARRPWLRCASRPLLALAAVLALAPSATAQTITYEGVLLDQSDLDQLNVGNEGYWFAQFDATDPVEGRWTGENPRDALPTWAGPLNHVTADPNDPLDPVNNNPATFLTRTWSQDGPARSKGGPPAWNVLTLPSGETGLSGAVVDPFTIGNSNNTINRIQLNAGVPSRFYFHVVTDNTNGEHDPSNRIRARAEIGESLPGAADGTQIEADFSPGIADMVYNGIADVYTWRYDGFVGGDYIKLQLNADANGAGGSLAGFLFDSTFAPKPIPEPARATLLGLGVLLLGLLRSAGAPRTRRSP